MKLFEYVNSLSRDMDITYRNSKLAISLDNQKENIAKMLKLVDKLDKLANNEDRSVSEGLKDLEKKRSRKAARFE